MNENELIERYLRGDLDADAVEQLEQRLAADPELRERYVFHAQLDTGLRELSIERSIEMAQDIASQDAILLDRSAEPSHRSRRRLTLILVVLAASLIALTGWRVLVPSPIATLASSENAAWESDLPTSPGAELGKGVLNLKSGVATIRFRSGAEVVVEAPANLELLSTMRARLNSGAAVVNVPEPAIGFVLETPSGYAVDYGTRFAVRINEEVGDVGFELIEGEIEVHHSESGQSMRLNEAGSAVSVSKSSLVELDPENAESDVNEETRHLRIDTNGRCGTAMPRFHKRHKFVDPAVLSVKRGGNEKWDFRSFFAFDLTGVNLDQVEQARIRLNLVPSHRGLASRLPKINRFGVYGMTNAAKSNWEIESTWEDAPGQEDGVLLGTFEIERSRQRGVFGISGDALLDFLKNRGGGSVTFILVRETTQIEGVGPGLTHMFASDRHPESVGPTLELSVR